MKLNQNQMRMMVAITLRMSNVDEESLTPKRKKKKQ